MDTTERIRELLLRARTLEQEAEGCRAEAKRLVTRELEESIRDERRALGN